MGTNLSIFNDTEFSKYRYCRDTCIFYHSRKSTITLAFGRNTLSTRTVGFVSLHLSQLIIRGYQCSASSVVAFFDKYLEHLPQTSWFGLCRLGVYQLRAPIGLGEW